MSRNLMDMPTITIQEPESGLDIFLREAAKIPQYQAQARADRRADARLELEKRKMDTDNERYLDSINQQNIINEREQDKLDETIRSNKQREFQSSYELELANMDNLLKDSYPDTISMSELNIDSVLAGISDPRVANRIRRQVENRKNAAIKQRENAKVFMDTFNSRRSGSQMTEIEAIRAYENPEVFKQHLYDEFIKDKPDLTERQSKELDFLARRLSNSEKLLADAVSKKASFRGEDAEIWDAEIAKHQGDIDDYQSRVDLILNADDTDYFAGVGGDPGVFNNDLPTMVDDYVGYDKTPIPFRPPDDADIEYDIVFNQDEDVLDNIADIAKENAVGGDVDDVSAGQSILRGISSVTGAPVGGNRGQSQELNIDNNTPLDSLEYGFAGGEFIGPATKEDYEYAKEQNPDYFKALEKYGLENNKEVKPLEKNLGFKTPDGKVKSMGNVTSDVSKSLKSLDKFKESFKDILKPSKKKMAVANKIIKIQKDMLETLGPYISEDGNLKDIELTDKFYKMLSGKTGISEPRLKQLLTFNMGFNI